MRLGDQGLLTLLYGATQREKRSSEVKPAAVKSFEGTFPTKNVLFTMCQIDTDL